MSKLSSMAKEYSHNNCHDESEIFNQIKSFQTGFEVAFKIIKDELNNKIKQMEEYPVMGERIIALKSHMFLMDELLREMKSNEF